MAFIGSWSGISLCLRIVNYDASVMLTGKMSTVHPPLRSQWTTASFDFHQMAVHKRTTMLAHCNLKQNTWLCSKQSSFFPFFMHCPLVANRKTRWSIQDHRMFRYKIDHRSAWRLRLFYLNTFVKPNYVRMHQLAADLGLSFELLVRTIFQCWWPLPRTRGRSASASCDRNQFERSQTAFEKCGRSNTISGQRIAEWSHTSCIWHVRLQQTVAFWQK